MLISMTGFGKAHYEDEEFFVNVEIKTLNSKYLDLNLKTPKSLESVYEIEIRQLLTQQLERGKVSLVIEYYPKNTTTTQLKINDTLAQTYYNKLSQLAQKLDAPTRDIFRYCLQMPEVIIPEEQHISEDMWQKIKTITQEALQHCITYRTQEGQRLQEYFETYIQNITKLLQNIKTQEAKRLEVIRERLHHHQQEIAQNDMFDQNRFEQEMIYYIEKLDITEERVRLESHLQYFLDTMYSPKMSGKKLNFIAQEIGREVNTIGAKANDSLIQHWVVEMKDELEKIKEQIQNIL